MTFRHAVLIGSIVLLVAVLGAKVIAPYRIVVIPNSEHPAYPFIYRLNVVTGSVTQCGSHLTASTNLFQMYCD